MMSYEHIAQASTLSGWSGSVTHGKENIKQSNANSNHNVYRIYKC